MANKQIFDLTEKTSVVDDDVFAIDDSEASNITKKVKVSRIKTYLKTYLDTLYVALTGNQTVAGVKTFSSFPVTPSSAPTTDYQVANKKYVDDNAGGGGATIAEGALPVYDSATGYHVEPGDDWNVNGTSLTWASNITRSSLSLSADTLYYIYLYDSGSGVAAVEESTTAPTWNSTYNYWQKTADATRRCMGAFASNSSSNISKFLCVENQIFLTFYYVDVNTNERSVLSAGGATTVTSFSLSPYVPAHAYEWYASVKLNFGAGGNDAILGVSPNTMSLAIASATFVVRDSNSLSGKTFFGSSWLPIDIDNDPQTNYYAINNQVGTNTADIQVAGFRMRR